MKALAALTAVALLTGCPAMQPYVRADREGYEVGIRGEWRAVRAEVARLAGEEDFKAVRH